MRLLFTLVVFLQLTFTAFGQVPGGTYVVQTSNADPNFRTLTAAITRINNVGVSGPVVLALAQNQTLTNPVVINAFTGASATNTLTIRPNAGQNNIVISGAFTNRGVIELNGADFVTIDGNNTSTDQTLTIFNNFNDNSNSYSNRAAIRMYGGATNNRIRNAIIQTNIVGITNGTNSIGIYAGGNANFIANGDNATNTIENNQFVNVKQGIWVTGNSTANSGWEIRNNTIGNSNNNSKPYYGIYLNNTTNATVTGNVLDGIRRPNGLGGSPSFGGIYIFGANAVVTSNTVKNLENATGNDTNIVIYVEGNTAVISDNNIESAVTNSSSIGLNAIHVKGNNGTVNGNEIYTIRASDSKLATGIYVEGNSNTLYNNMVSNVSSAGGGDPSSQGGYGIYLKSGTGNRLYYNSVLLKTNQSTGASACLYIDAGAQFDIRNNVFVNQQTSGSIRFAVYSNITNQSSFTQIDYNDYVSSQHIGSWGSYYTTTNRRTSLANWQTSTGKDQNSISVTPDFVSDTDLRLESEVTNFDNEGVVLSGFSSDIDGQERSTTTPDMGADEFSRCSTTTAWSGTAWSNGTPTATSSVVLNGNYNTATNGSFVCCELRVKNNRTLTIAPHTVVQVENGIDVEGALDIADGGSLVQISDTATHNGNITVKRKTTPLKQYDYIYWSSPLKNQPAHVLVNNAPTWTFKYDPMQSGNSDYGWVFVNENDILVPGLGYSARAPENLTYNPTNSYEVTFTGIPNTGVVTIPAAKNGTATFNLIGNPYPSALDADLFLSNANNLGILTGTIYIWTHNSAISTAFPGNYAYNYSADDYAVYNLTGSVKGLAATSGGVAPNGKIASGQGFFVEVQNNLSNGVRNLIVNNSMRVKTANSNNQFFRPASQVQATTFSEPSNSGKSRVWLNLTNPDGAYTETLIGYVPGATNEIDYGFDGDVNNGGNYFSFYSLLNDKKLVIQGRDLNFSDNDVIPLGYTSTLETPASIGIENLDGFFENQDVFLLDKDLDILTNIKETRYHFTTTVGTFDERFELRFTSAPLSVDNPDSSSDLQVIKTGNKLGFRSNGQKIASISVFDVSGKKIRNYNTENADTFYIDDLASQNRLIIAQISLENGTVVSRKIIH
ncbi:hypothetical protein [Flavobacterium sp.]|uniref:hypothetical protein n=1 Tax=Flavobacterium sp. TaxID=239 RepID=UPI003B9B551E